MFRSIILIVAVLMVISIIPVFAKDFLTPFNVNGATGLINIPVADTLDQGQIRLGIHDADLSEKTGSSVSGDWDGYLGFGIMKGFEMSAQFLDGNGDVSYDAQYKYPQSVGNFDIAAGIQNITGVKSWEAQYGDPGPNDKYYKASPYVVTSRSFGEGDSSFDVHVGLGMNRFNGLFGGVSKYIGTKTQLMLAYDGHVWNAGAKYLILPSNLGGANILKQPQMNWIIAVNDLSKRRDVTVGIDMILNNFR